MKPNDYIRFPSGLSIGQIRKNAKLYAREHSISQSAALNALAVDNGINRPWNRAIVEAERRAYFDEIYVDLSFIDEDGITSTSTPTSISRDPLWFICGNAGCGKTTLSLLLAERLRAHFERIYYITSEGGMNLHRKLPKGVGYSVISPYKRYSFRSLISEGHVRFTNSALIVNPEGVASLRTFLFSDKDQLNKYYESSLKPITINFRNGADSFDFLSQSFCITTHPDGRRDIFNVGNDPLNVAKNLQGKRPRMFVMDEVKFNKTLSFFDLKRFVNIPTNDNISLMISNQGFPDIVDSDISDHPHKTAFIAHGPISLGRMKVFTRLFNLYGLKTINDQSMIDLTNNRDFKNLRIFFSPLTPNNQLVVRQEDIRKY